MPGSRAGLSGLPTSTLTLFYIQLYNHVIHGYNVNHFNRLSRLCIKKKNTQQYTRKEE